MLSVSDTFLATLRTANRRKSIVNFYYGSDDLPLIEGVGIVDGSLSIDRSNDVRRSGSLIVSMDPATFSNLDPYGIYLNIKSGFVFPSGNEELVSLGWFTIEDANYNEGSGELTIDFYDRSKLLQDIQSFQDTDRSAFTCIQLIQLAFDYTWANLGYEPTVTFDASLASGRKMPGGSVVTGTGLDTCNMVAQALAAEFYFDATGNAVVKPIPTISSTTTVANAVWTIDVGETGVLVEANHSITRANTFNGIAMYGATTDSGGRIYYIATDTSPSSKTYFSGKFGRKTKRVENDSLVTLAQCQAAAQSELANCVGLSKSVSFTSIWNPALQEGDIVALTFLDNTTELHLIDTLSFSFKSGEMSGTTRTVQLVTG